MKRISRGLGGIVVGALVLLAARPVGAQNGSSGWLHIRVEEGSKSSKVAVNLPLAVVEAVLAAAPDTLERHGRLKLGKDSDVSIAQMRTIWKELKNAGDMDFVTVQDEGENVKVGRRGGLVQVLVDKGGKEQVQVQIPVPLVDALLAGEGDELDVKRAVAVLAKQRGDIVQVKDGAESVRIWIDENSGDAK